MELFPKYVSLDFLAERWGKTQQEVLKGLDGQVLIHAEIKNACAFSDAGRDDRPVFYECLPNKIIEDLLHTGNAYFKEKIRHHHTTPHIYYMQKKTDGSFNALGAPITFSEVRITRDEFLRLDKLINQSIANQGVLQPSVQQQISTQISKDPASTDYDNWLSRYYRSLSPYPSLITGSADIPANVRSKFVPTVQDTLSETEPTVATKTSEEKPVKGVVAVSPGTEWEDITICFTSATKINISINGKKRPVERSFKSFDFSYHSKSDKPTKTWNTLRDLAVQRVIPLRKLNFDSKQVSLLRGHLKEIFPSVVGEPIMKYSKKEKSWSLKINLTLSDQLYQQNQP